MSDWSVANRGVCRFASLVITEQPLPQVVFKSKTMEDAYSVLLITGAYTDVQALSKVKASLVSEEQNWKSPPLENDTAPMDQSTVRAFSCVVF